MMFITLGRSSSQHVIIVVVVRPPCPKEGKKVYLRFTLTLTLADFSFWFMSSFSTVLINEGLCNIEEVAYFDFSEIFLHSNNLPNLA